jgi:hypothetical protein
MVRRAVHGVGRRCRRDADADLGASASAGHARRDRDDHRAGIRRRFAVALGSDVLTWRMLVGGGLVLAAMYLVELMPRRRAEGELPAEAVHHEV